jgi:hypothetical protein
MAVDDIDIKALDDLPDPEELVSGDENIAYAQARRLLQPDGELAEIGDDGDFECMDIRDALGRRLDEIERADLEQRANRAASADGERVESAQVSLTLSGNQLTVNETHATATGDYSLVLTVDGVTVSMLKDG